MNGHDRDNGFRQVTTQVQSNDVFQSNRSADPSTTNNCQVTAPPTAADQPAPTPTPACTDNDGDGYGSGPECLGGDCDDYNPAVTVCDDGGGDKFCGGDCALRCAEVGAYCDPGCNCYTPVVVDTAGDGIELTDGRNGVNFDIDGDPSTVNRLGWTRAGSDDAWLALDRNGNGAIDDGTELFGDLTPQPASDEPNGFLALAEFDRPAAGGDGDGAISRRDAVFANLRLWQDANHNGVSESGELHGLAALGLKSIDLDFKTSKRRDGHGNVFRYRAKVRDARGRQIGRWAWDVFLVPER